MRQITKDSVAAFMAGRVFNRDNTSVEVREFKSEDRLSAVLKLHGNVIARRSLDGAVFEVCDGGWQTRTTAERLNGLPGVRVHQKKGQWFLNDAPWSGDGATIQRG